MLEMSKNERRELNKKSLELIKTKNANELYEMIGTELLAVDSSILDASPSIGANRRHGQGRSEFRHCDVEFKQDKIIIHKRGFWTGKDKGTQIVHFDRISNIDLDKGYWASHITIGLTGADVVVLRLLSEVDEVKQILDEFLEIYRRNTNKDQTGDFSIAEEIEKNKKLFDEKIITLEEFEQIKNKLITRL
ncbi:MAG: SHOCT domain-containing protein partial [Methanobrevibacter sp. CfCl-M3]